MDVFLNIDKVHNLEPDKQDRTIQLIITIISVQIF